MAESLQEYREKLEKEIREMLKKKLAGIGNRLRAEKERIG